MFDQKSMECFTTSKEYPSLDCNFRNNTISDIVSQTEGNGIYAVLNERVADMIKLVTIPVICAVISFCGIISNIINVLVFMKLGLTDNVNISLTALAGADLGISLTLQWQSICHNPIFESSDLPFKSTEISSLTAGYPRLCLTRISSWIMAFVTLERCLCVTLPLKVKAVITTQRTSVVIVSIFVTMVASIIPFYFGSTQFTIKFDSTANKTYVGTVRIQTTSRTETVAWGIESFLTISSFLVVGILTATLVWSLNTKRRWRQSLTNETLRTPKHLPKSSNYSTTIAARRDKQVAKMVSLISLIFLVCFLPTFLNQLASIFVYDYVKISEVFWPFSIVTEGAYASVNIVIYLKMSSNYRKTLMGWIIVGKNLKK